jgi:hypothetical protein
MDEQAKRQQILDKLRQERDELRVRLHLGKAELKDEWEALEKKWERLEARMAEAAEGARETSREVGATFGVLSEEIGEAYRRIRARLR